MTFRRTGLLACILVAGVLPVAQVSAQSLDPWNVQWDVQLEDEALAAKIKGLLESASTFYETQGFKRPRFRDSNCAQPNPVPVTDHGDAWQSFPEYSRNAPFRYAHHEGECGVSLLLVNVGEFRRFDDETQKYLVAMELFTGVMMAYDGFRTQRPPSKVEEDGWFTYALRWAMAIASDEGAGFHWKDVNEKANRSFGAPLNEPPCDDFGTGAGCQDIDGTWLFWALVATMSNDQAGNAIGLILDNPLDGEWQSKFYLDSVDAGLHEVLANTCSRLTLAGSESWGGVCQGLCGGHKPIRIRYLDVEEGREGHEEELQSCIDPVGGLHFMYPMFATYLVHFYDDLKQEVVERMFPARPGREYPAGCVQAEVGGELSLSLEPMGIECVIVEGLPRKSGGLFLVDARASDPEILANLHLSWDKCAYAGELIDWENGSWTKFWDVDRSAAPVKDCVGEGDKVVLTFTNVATRASETRAIHDLRLNLLHHYQGEIR